MENENKIGEQPQIVGSPEIEESYAEVLQNESETSLKSGASDAEAGEPIGKFKSVKDLYEAYNNLQSEFTRKSQRLSEIEKEQMPDEQTENGFKAFLSKNQEAFAYADELKKRVSKEELHDETAFEKAWAGILYEKLSAGNAEFQNLILKDDKIKDMVIKNYVKSLQEQKTPFVMSTNSGERVTRPVTPKPDTFESAKKVVLDLLS